MARAEDQRVQAVWTGAQRVLLAVGDVDDRVAGAHLADLLVLPEQARATEDEEDLVGAPMGVRRRREASRRDADAVDADALRAGGVPEPLNREAHRRAVDVTRLHVVPVRDHTLTMSVAIASSTRSAARTARTSRSRRAHASASRTSSRSSASSAGGLAPSRSSASIRSSRRITARASSIGPSYARRCDTSVSSSCRVSRAPLVAVEAEREEL